MSKNKIRYKMRSSMILKRTHMKMLKYFKTVYQISTNVSKSGDLVFHFSLKNDSEQQEIENHISGKLKIKLENIHHGK